MSKVEGNLIKARVTSIGSRFKTMIFNFFKLFLLSPYYMPSTGLSRLHALFYLIFKTSLGGILPLLCFRNLRLEETK